MIAPAFPFILASASPRRLVLLAQIGVVPSEIVAAEIDEAALKGELPLPYARRMAREKMEAVAAKYPDAAILSADTVVALGRRILPKAEDAKTARICLQLLSGRRHQVHTAIMLRKPHTVREKTVTSLVKFKRLTESELAGYLAACEWEGKAGGYAIQGLAAAFIPWLSGSYSNVVGLPLAETAQLLR